MTLEGVEMAGYDTNRPRPTDSGSFVGLPGDPVVAHPSGDHQVAGEDNSEVVSVAGGEDDIGPTLQSVPQAVPPLDRRVPMMAVIGGLGGLVIVLLIWRRLMGRRG
ncbi:MAG TPA: hypothetical protein DCL16_04620 [Acidimicrobiaceae bacterium]|nr:hypothetical protein [Acidimicrobiaceae bacterium]